MRKGKVKRDLLSLLDVKEDLLGLLDLTAKLKRKTRRILEGKTLALLFEKPSTRTRASFEVALNQLGGFPLYLSSRDLQLGRGESIADTARTLSRYVDGMVYRAFDHTAMVELAKHASVPVINGLDDLEHPCQIIADLFTIQEKKNTFDLKLAYLGDGNNVCNSLLLGTALVGMRGYFACPSGYKPNKEITEKAKRIAPDKIKILESSRQAVKNAEIVYTDVWVSMGNEAERERRINAFKKYQVNQKLLNLARDNCMVMHCLPAHRGEEITNEVIDGKNSIVWDQAENRLHAQKAILATLMR